MLFGSISEKIISVCIWLISGIYNIASMVFQIFFDLASGDVVSPEVYQNVLNNFYVILGVGMLFIIAFSMLKGMVNPDDQAKGTGAVKKIVINLVTSLIILAVLPTVFSFAYDFQDIIIRYNTLGTIFGYGTPGDSNGGKDVVKSQSYTIANSVFTAFFNVNEDECDNKSDIISCQKELVGDSKVECPNGSDGKKGSFYCVSQSVQKNGKFGQYTSFAEAADDSEIDFNFILALAGGVLLLYVGISFCFDMAMRMIKLIFYQIIAPIPILFRIIPEGKLSDMFGQWVKITLTCYLEVFVRILVLYVALFLCQAVIDANLFASSLGWFGSLITKAFVLMGIVMFMKQAPKLLSEITGLDSGNMKLGIREKLANGGAFTAGAIAGGALTAGIRNATGSFAKTRQKYYNYDEKNQKWVRKKGATTAKILASGITGTLKSTTAGTISGAVRSGKAGIKAGSFSDMKGAASKGAKGAVDARLKRDNYRAAHSSGETGIKGYFHDSANVALGHVKDNYRTVKNYALDQSIEGLTRESQNMGKLAGNYNAFSDGIEALLEKEQSKGDGSTFLGHGFEQNTAFSDAYKTFDEAAGLKRSMQAAFSSGRTIAVPVYNSNGQLQYDSNHNIITQNRTVTEEDLRNIEAYYTKARDNARDGLMNISLGGSKGTDYINLDEKGRATLKDSMVNAENLKASVLENANSKAVQEVMGANGALQKIANNEALTADSFTNGNVKLKDSAKVAQAEADIKIAEMNKENAAKGDKQ